MKTLGYQLTGRGRGQMAKSRRIVSRPACGNGKKVLAVATFVATFVPLAPVYAQVSVPRSQIADTSKSARRCDVHADCSGLSIDDIRASFTDDADADMAYFEIASGLIGTDESGLGFRVPAGCATMRDAQRDQHRRHGFGQGSA